MKTRITNIWRIVKIALITSLSIFILAVVVVILTAIVPRPIRVNGMKFNGVVKQVYNGGVNDVCLVIEDIPIHFYINRGLENGLNIDTLQQIITGKPVTIYATKDRFNILDLKNKHKHVYELKMNDQIIYSEYKSEKTNIKQ